MTVSDSPVTGDIGDVESALWVEELQADTGAVRDAAIARLHTMLVRVARGEVRRRAGTLRISGPELDDLAHQAAGDAVMAILRKVSTFRGESRFTTWAYRFVVLEVSSKLGRHFWRGPGVSLDVEQWERLPDRFGLDPVVVVVAFSVIVQGGLVPTIARRAHIPVRVLEPEPWALGMRFPAAARAAASVAATS